MMTGLVYPFEDHTPSYAQAWQLLQDKCCFGSATLRAAVGNELLPLMRRCWNAEFGEAAPSAADFEAVLAYLTVTAMGELQQPQMERLMADHTRVTAAGKAVSDPTAQHAALQ